WSMYSWMVMEGFEPLTSFEAALDAEGIRKSSQAFHAHNPEYWRDYLYFDGGLYRQQVERFLHTFNNVHLLLFDDLVADPADTFSGICQFLDVDSDVQPEFTAENRSRFPKMTRAQYSLRSARDVARNLPVARRQLTHAAESLMQTNVRHG